MTTNHLRALAWPVLIAWLALAVAGAVLAGGDDNLTPEDLAYSPSTTPRLADEPPRTDGLDTEELTFVFAAGQALTAGESRALADFATGLRSAGTVGGARVLAVGDARPSPDGHVTVIEAEVELRDDDDEALAAAVDGARALARSAAPPGVAAHVTGEAAIDADTAAGDVNATLLLTSVAVVAIILVLIYRSPLLWLLPILTGVAAVQVAHGLVVTAAGLGLAVTEITVAILIVVVFGVGTDYALLVLNRYRRERPAIPDRHAALTVALRRTARPILLSAGIVVITLTALLLCSLEGLRGMGPALGIGVAVAAAAQLTLLPALLTIVGERAFWPTDPSRPMRRQGLWTAIAVLVTRRPRAVAAGTLAVLAAAAALGLSWQPSADPLGLVPASSDARAGALALREHVGGGVTDPVTVLDVTPELADRIAERDDVVHTEPGQDATGRPILEIYLAETAYQDGWLRAVDELRGELAGSGARLAGDAILTVESEAAVAHDTGVLIGAVAVLLLGLLLVLWRSLRTAVTVAVGTAMGFAAALGVSLQLFGPLAGGSTSTHRVVLFSFVFLITFGVDYVVFLMERVREERHAGAGREAVPLALARTGGVISAAGVVLAATFAMLMLVPEVSVRQVGLVVALGVLVDTFLVRTLLIPALLLIRAPAKPAPEKVLGKVVGPAGGRDS